MDREDGHREAVTALVEGLVDATPEQLGHAEDLLIRLSAGQPAASTPGSDKDSRTKFRDAKRTPHKSAPEVETDKPAEEADGEADRQVYKVKPAQKRKPMTVEEAVLEMDKTRDYLVYRDAQTDKVSVLVRRRDGHFDLVEG